jgi:hypothetical protein
MVGWGSHVGRGGGGSKLEFAKVTVGVLAFANAASKFFGSFSASVGSPPPVGEK